MVDNAATSAGLFERIPALKQILLLVGLAASIAGGISVVLWSREPDFQMLYGQLEDRDASAVVQALAAAGVNYKLDPTTGGILVPSDQVHDARLKLASEGLPQGTGMGVELIQAETGFAVSQFMEGARYQHALETELARSIINLRPVERARVHLALPRQSVFLRERQPPTASVLLHLHSGRQLEDSQVASIVHLVASSIPGLDSRRVTVVDQHGRLLSAPNQDSDVARDNRQFERRRRLEESYAQRINNILAPILGPGRVRATVSAEMDFTVSEETRETYDPARSVVRSEQLRENSKSRSSGPQGIPGALSNQPPEDAAVFAAEESNGPKPLSESRESTRNYEVDRTVSHIRSPTGKVTRLSVAVLVDHRRTVSKRGKVTVEPLASEELEEIRDLVRQTVGFDETRGDTVSVINASFADAPTVEPLPEPGLLEQGWVRDLLRQVGTVAVLFMIVFGVVRPAVRNLSNPAPARLAAGPGVQVQVEQSDIPGLDASRPQISYEERIAAARNMAAQNPEMVAQMMKDWVGTNG